MDNSKKASSLANIGEYVNIIAYAVEGFVFFILLFLFFIPTYQEIRSYQNDIEIKKTELKGLIEYARYLEELANATLAIEEEIIHYALPSENDVVTLIVTYEGLASSNEDLTVSPVNLSPGVLTQEEDAQEEGQTGLQTVNFDMEVTGSDNEKVFDFISQIMRTRRIFDITNISMAMPTEEDPEDTISLSLSLATYYYIAKPVASNRALVKQGQEQELFIAQLQEATVFEDLLLEGVELGKDDLFARDASFQQPTPTIRVSPTASASGELETQSEE